MLDATDTVLASSGWRTIDRASVSPRSRCRCRQRRHSRAASIEISDRLDRRVHSCEGWTRGALARLVLALAGIALRADAAAWRARVRGDVARRWSGRASMGFRRSCARSSVMIRSVRRDACFLLAARGSRSRVVVGSRRVRAGDEAARERAPFAIPWSDPSEGRVSVEAAVLLAGARRDRFGEGSAASAMATRRARSA